MKASEEVIVNFENLICVTINERETLLEALFQHIKPAFYRMKYHYHIEQSILDMVLPQYASLHAIVRKSIGPVEKLVGVEVPDEELVLQHCLEHGFEEKEFLNLHRKQRNEQWLYVPMEYRFQIFYILH